MARVLGFIGGQNAYVGSEGRFTHVTTGRVLEEFSRHYARIYWCTGVSPTRAGQDDYPIPPSVDIVPIPRYNTTIQAMRQLSAIKRGYHELFSHDLDRLFIRGFVPGVRTIYTHCRRQGMSPAHWLVGNPVALLKSHRRKNRLVDFAGLKFSEMWERDVFSGIDQTDGVLLCNGRELFERCAGHRRIEVVSSVIRLDDILERQQVSRESEVLNITTVCFVRPEKGVEHLIEAAALLKSHVHFQLHIVGSRTGYPAYQALLDQKIQELQLTDIVTFHGHATRDNVLEHLRRADIFAFSSLSEGTPHVLVEALANGAVIATTNVGGIPSVVQDGVNALLVPSKSPTALASALKRLAGDQQLRKDLARAGYLRAAELTVDKFVQSCVTALEGNSSLAGLK